MLFAAIKGPQYHDAITAIQKLQSFVDGFELRIDLFATIDLEKLQHLMSLTPLPFLITLKSSSQGGKFTDQPSVYQQTLVDLLSLQPRYIDLPFDFSPSISLQLQKQFNKTVFICSYHNFDHTPNDLRDIFIKMQQVPAHAYKIVTMAKSSLDALRMLLFVKEKSAQGLQITGLCMGEEGVISRILGPIVGNFIDFASFDSTSTTASGQLTVETLLQTYRYRSLNAQSHVYALIGNPVDESYSNLSHNAVFKELNHNAVYVKIKIQPYELPSFFPLAKKLPIQGLSITMPLKELIIPYMHTTSSIVKKMGVINTVVVHDNKWEGHNTDAAGALDAIEKYTLVRDKKMIVLGAGGAAKAVAFEALQRGAEVTILNRTQSKAVAIAEELHCNGLSLVYMDAVANKGYDILINGTSVGMFPDIGHIPINPQYILQNTLVMDMISRPKKTRFLQEAEKKKCSIICGSEMFVNQAIRQFTLWLGNPTNIKNANIHRIIENTILNTQDKNAIDG